MIWGLLLNRYMAGGVLILAAVVAFWVWLERHDADVESRVLARINHAAEELADEAVKARAPALRPGSFARLRANYCLNCKADVPSNANGVDR